MAPGFSPEAALHSILGACSSLEGGQKLLELEISLQACKDLPLFHASVTPSMRRTCFGYSPHSERLGILEPRAPASFERLSAQHLCLSSQKPPRCEGIEDSCQLCQLMATAGPLGEAFLNPSGRIGMAGIRM